MIIKINYKRMRIKIFSIMVLLLICGWSAHAQKVAVKTNLLYGAGTLTPNLGIEFGLGQRATLDLWGGYNPWNIEGTAMDNKKWVHYLVQPEFRYWFCERFNGHFLGLHGLYGQYNVGGIEVPNIFGSEPLMDKNHRYEGSAYGGGLSYGYHWMWNKRWGMEFTVGFGAARFEYDKYKCEMCSEVIGKESKTYFGPTKAGITLVFLIK